MGFAADVNDGVGVTSDETKGVICRYKRRLLWQDGDNPRQKGSEFEDTALLMLVGEGGSPCEYMGRVVQDHPYRVPTMQVDIHPRYFSVGKILTTIYHV
jgi:hypothetical protein